MEAIYSNIKHPAGLGSVKKLYDAIKKKYPNRTYKIEDVKKFLSSKDSYTLHKVKRKKFIRRRVQVVSPGHTIISDVAYFKMYKKFNKPYFLILIDGFSRYLSVKPLQNLKSSEVVPVLEDFFLNNIYKYSKIFTDEGIEYKNKKVNQLYKDLNICWYTTYSKEIKASIAERVILTLKRKITKYISNFNTEYFMKDLQTIVNTYNITPHKGLKGETPLDVHLLYKWKDIKTHSQKIYKTQKKYKETVRNFLRAGQVVRITSARKTFSRSYHVQNTYELFKIEKVNKHHVPTTYSLVDLDGVEIKGIFYIHELIPVINSEYYKVDIVKKRGRGNSTKYLVKYVNYPNSKQQWVNRNQLKKLM